MAEAIPQVDVPWTRLLLSGRQASDFRMVNPPFDEASRFYLHAARPRFSLYAPPGQQDANSTTFIPADRRSPENVRRSQRPLCFRQSLAGRFTAARKNSPQTFPLVSGPDLLIFYERLILSGTEIRPRKTLLPRRKSAFTRRTRIGRPGPRFFLMPECASSPCRSCSAVST